MPYILYKTDGAVLTTVEDAGLDTTTDLKFVGRNYAGYGQIQNENFLKLLENFSNSSAPAKPLKGQIWFDSGTNTVKFSYNGKEFKGLANIFVQGQTPLISSLNTGDLWWDTTTAQLKLFDGNSFPVIGPISAATQKAFWSPDLIATDLYSELPILKATLDGQIVAVVSYVDITTTNPSDLYDNDFLTLKPGISLPGTDSDGKSESSGYLFWGSASHSKLSNTATYAFTATTATIANSATQIAITDVGSSIENKFLTFVTTSTTTQDLLVSGNLFYNPSTDVLNATATAAFYADLAERYEADNEYHYGTVLKIGGIKEVTISNIRADVSVAGVVSKNPAYMMNADAGSNLTHPYIALKGRVICKIAGPVTKGQLLVSSAIPGHAEAFKEGDNPLAVIGIALEEFIGETGKIEIKV